jgi:hypothetical protein
MFGASDMYILNKNQHAINEKRGVIGAKPRGLKKKKKFSEGSS